LQTENLPLLICGPQTRTITLSYTVSPRRIHDIIDGRLKKDYYILIFLVRIFLSTTVVIKWPFKLPPHLTSAFALPGKNRISELLHFYSRQHDY